MSTAATVPMAKAAVAQMLTHWFMEAVAEPLATIAAVGGWVVVVVVVVVVVEVSWVG